MILEGDLLELLEFMSKYHEKEEEFHKYDTINT